MKVFEKNSRVKCICLQEVYFAELRNAETQDKNGFIGKPERPDLRTVIRLGAIYDELGDWPHGGRHDVSSSLSRAHLQEERGVEPSRVLPTKPTSRRTCQNKYLGETPVASAGKTCREAGAIVSCRTGLRDMNMAASAHNDKAIEVLATGLSDDRTRSSVDGAVHQSA